MAEASEPADGWLDRTKAGELLRRYHGAAERSFYRALAELNRTRRLPDSPVIDGARNEARLFVRLNSHGNSPLQFVNELMCLVLAPRRLSRWASPCCGKM